MATALRRCGYTGNDIIYTPIELAKAHIATIPYIEGEVWLDPWSGAKVYYDNYPVDCLKDYCEITEGKDFLQYQGKVDVICSNPPYSQLNAMLMKCISLSPRVISVLVGFHHLSPRRLELMESKGYYLSNQTVVKVKQWFCWSAIATFTKTEPGVLHYITTNFDTGARRCKAR